MQEHVDIGAAEPKRRRHVFTRAIFEQTHHHHRALLVAQSVHASVQANTLFGVSEQTVDGQAGIRRLQAFDTRMRPREVMSAPFVACCVDDDAANKRFVVSGWQLAGLGESQESAKRIVHTIECVLGPQTLAAGQTGKRETLLTHDPLKRLQDIRRNRHLLMYVPSRRNLTTCKMPPARHL